MKHLNVHVAIPGIPNVRRNSISLEDPRTPQTERNGRVHTSNVTAVVLDVDGTETPGSQSQLAGSDGFINMRIDDIPEIHVGRAYNDRAI
jgi:hypothetical protein